MFCTGSKSIRHIDQHRNLTDAVIDPWRLFLLLTIRNDLPEAFYTPSDLMRGYCGICGLRMVQMELGLEDPL